MKRSPIIDYGVSYFEGVDRLLKASVNETQTVVDRWYEAVDIPLKNMVALIIKTGSLSSQQRIEHLNRLRTMIDAFPHPPHRFSRENLTTTILNSIIRGTELKTDRVVCPVEPEAFTATSGDTRLLQYQKFACRIDYTAASALRSFISFFSRNKVPILRRFDGSGFIRIYFTIPFERILLEAWNRFNHAATDVIISCTTYLDNHASDTSTIKSAGDTRMAHLLQSLLDVHAETRQHLTQKIQELISNVNYRLRIAGTTLLPGKMFNRHASVKLHRQFGSQFIKDRDAWKRHWQGVFMDLHKDIDLLRLEDEIHEEQSGIQDTIDQNLKVPADALFEEIQHIFIGMKHDAASTNLISRNEVRRFLLAERKIFTGDAADQHLIPLSEIVISFDLNGLLDAYKQKIRNAAELLQERYAIFTHSDRESLIPESQFDMVPLRELFLHYLDSEVQEKIERIGENGRNSLIALSNQPVILREIIEVTLDTAYAELRKTGNNDDEASCIDHVVKEFNDGIDRSLETLDSMRRLLETTVDELYREISGSCSSMQSYISDLRRSERLFELNLKLMRSRTVNRLKTIKQTTTKQASTVFRVGYLKTRMFAFTIWKPLFRFYRTFSRATRLDVRTPSRRGGSVETYLKMARNSLANLPAVYRRAFRFDPLDSEKLLTNRENVLNTVGNAFNEWHNGLTGLIALTGERGSGRSSLARIARMRYFKDLPVVRVVPSGTLLTESDLTGFLCGSLGIDLVESLETLEQHIADSEEYRVLIMEDIHHIFLKTITGLRIFKRFLLFATRTQTKVFWFLTCGEYAWKYLDRVLSLNRYFSTVVPIDGLPTDDVEELIMRRHRLCGIPIRFIADNRIVRTKKYRQCVNQQQQQALLQKQFFKTLTDASTGNVSVAMLLWCIAIKNIDNKRFEISGLPDLNLMIDTTVSTDELFVIAAIVLHERISPCDLGNVLTIPPETALLHLTGLMNKGFLIELNGFYELHFFLYRSFIGYLHEKRLLY